MGQADATDRAQLLRDDLELVRNARTGEPEAVRCFVARMRFVPRALAAKNVQFGRPLGPSELEDLSQDVIAIIWRKLDDYAGTGTFEAWTYRICFLQFLNFLRKRDRHPRSFASIGDAAPEPLAPPASAQLEHEDVYAGLEHVGPPDAEILRMKHLEGLTFTEMGERLGVSPNTLKSRYYRGLRRLRHYIEACTPLVERGAR